MKMNIEKIPVRVAIVMLLLAIPPMWPYGYYTLLRLVVCGVSIYVVLQAKKSKDYSWMWGMGFIALLFNPLIPIHLNKGLWAVIDLGVAAIFAILLSKFKK